MSKMKQLLLDTIEASLPEEEQAYVPTFPDTLTEACDEAVEVIEPEKWY